MISALPRRMRCCLWLVTTTRDRESIFGDLEEEFLGRSRSGDLHALSWLRRQCGRSIRPLLRCCYRRGEFHLALALVACGYVFPLRLLDLAWAFVLSQVPLKTEASRGWSELAAAVAFSAAFGALAGHLLRTGYGRDARRRGAWVAPAMVAATPLMVRVSPGAWPPGTSLLLALSAAGALLSCVCGDQEDKPSGRTLSC